MFLEKTASKNKFSGILSSITTDNCSAVLGAGDVLKDTPEFPFLAAHIGCLGHQLFLLTNIIVSEFVRAFKTIPDLELEALTFTEQLDYVIPMDEHAESDSEDESEVSGQNESYENTDHEGSQTLFDSDDAYSVAQSLESNPLFSRDSFSKLKDMTNQKEKLNTYKNLGKMINKSEDYRKITNSKINVRDYLRDPFDGVSIDPLVTLIKFTFEVRNSKIKYALFSSVVGKQFPHFQSIRWHIKFYIIEFFLENKIKIKEFLNEARDSDIEVCNILSENEIDALDMLFDALQPLAILTKVVQSHLPLISAYGPILFAARDHIESLARN